MYIQLGRIETDQDQVSKEGHTLVQAGPHEDILQIVGLKEQAQVPKVVKGLAASGVNCVSISHLHHRRPERRKIFPGDIIAKVKDSALVFGTPSAWAGLLLVRARLSVYQVV